jgi:sugar/nucleoside kinase (ribokinase family)
VDFDVVGLGLACVDDLLLLSNIPAAEGRAAIRRRDRQGGGMAATAMVAAARLGGAAGFVGKVGDDPAGAFILEDFRRYGVDVSRVVVERGATSHVTIVLVDAGSGARSFLGQRGSLRPLQPEEVDRDYVTSGRILHVSDADPAALQAARWARDAGREVSFDGTHFYPATLELLPLLDYLIVSRFFATELVAFREGRGLTRAARMFADPPALAGAAPGARAAPAPVDPPGGAEPDLRGAALLDAAVTMQRLGPPVVVVTEGEHGCWCASPQGTFHLPAFPAPAVVDTTGAGDVFHGAFLYARARGQEVREALRLAAATAALKCGALGGRVGIPTLAEALAFAAAGDGAVSPAAASGGRHGAG